ncbi:hypothetical protein BDR04DRAFT_1153479 [Suillus decipiens]|nr:hypothetical protein BDR04DRAFT_1153479 [Suillus decipiens]
MFPTRVITACLDCTVCMHPTDVSAASRIYPPQAAPLDAYSKGPKRPGFYHLPTSLQRPSRTSSFSFDTSGVSHIDHSRPPFVPPAFVLVLFGPGACASSAATTSALLLQVDMEWTTIGSSELDSSHGHPQGAYSFYLDLLVALSYLLHVFASSLVRPALPLAPPSHFLAPLLRLCSILSHLHPILSHNPRTLEYMIVIFALSARIFFLALFLATLVLARIEAERNLIFEEYVHTKVPPHDIGVLGEMATPEVHLLEHRADPLPPHLMSRKPLGTLTFSLTHSCFA